MTSEVTKYVVGKRYLYALQAGQKYRVGPPIDIVALAIREGKQDWHALIEFVDRAGGTKDLLLPLADLRQKHIVTTRLANAGYALPPLKDPKNDQLFDFLSNRSPKRRIVLVAQVGWSASNLYVLPDRIIGQLPTGSAEVMFDRFSADNSTNSSIKVSGTLAQWQNEIAQHIAGSPLCVFSVATAFASTVMKFVAVPSGIFHNFGHSQAGKTTGLLAAVSVFTKATEQTLNNWNTTVTAFADIANTRNDNLLDIDDLGHLSEPRADNLRKVAFMMSSGRDRARSKRYSANAMAGDLTWRFLGLSSGEESVAEVMRTSGKVHLPGHAIRLIDVPVPIGTDGSVFKTRPSGFANATTLASHIRDACSQYYGTAGVAFIEQLTKKTDADIGTQVRTLMGRFEKIARVPTAGYAKSFARRFAMSYAGGILAVRLGILPWPEQLVKDCCVQMYEAAYLYHTQTQEVILKAGLMALRERLRSANTVNLSKRGSSIDQSIVPRATVFRLRRRDAKGFMYACGGVAFRALFDQPGQKTLVLNSLVEHGILLSEESLRKLPTRQLQIPGSDERCRYFCLVGNARNRLKDLIEV